MGSYAGLYFVYGLKRHFITSGVEYYAKEATCNYKWVSSSKGQVVPNAIQFKSSPFTFYVGRTRSHGSTQVGKVALQHKKMYYAHGSEVYRTASYDVLVCDRVKPKTTVTRAPPKTTTTKRPAMTTQTCPLNDELLAMNAELLKLRDDQMLENGRLFNEKFSLKTQLNECQEKLPAQEEIRIN